MNNYKLYNRSSMIKLDHHLALSLQTIIFHDTSLSCIAFFITNSLKKYIFIIR